jgi:hypothetical protein
MATKSCPNYPTKWIKKIFASQKQDKNAALPPSYGGIDIDFIGFVCFPQRIQNFGRSIWIFLGDPGTQRDKSEVSVVFQ